MAEVIGYDRRVGKRPGKKLEAKASKSLDRLRRGQHFRQSQREELWRKVYGQYSGTQWQHSADDPTADLINVNISFSTLNTLLPFVADEDPHFQIAPYSGDATADNAALLESFLNRLWQSSDVEGTLHVRDAIFDYLLYGDGYVKVGYEIAEQPVFTTTGEKVDNDVEIASFFVERINPWDVWIDPYSDGITNARWVCQRILIPLNELDEDDRFAFSAKDHGVQGVDQTGMAPEDQERLRYQQDEEWVTLYEFYDLKERTALTFTEGGRVLRFIEHIQCPIVQIQNYRIPNSPYHMGELEQIAPLQDELNKTRSQMITHRRRNVAKWLAREHLLNSDAEQAMKSSKVNDIIPVEGMEPFDELIAPVAPQPLPADSYMIDSQIRNDINEVSGVNEYLRGVPQNISRTATEATIIEGATNIRTRHKLLQVEAAAQRVGQLLLDTMQDVLPLTQFEEMSMYVTGREAEKLNRATGQEQLDTDVLITPTPEIFVGKYEVRVERGSTELRNPEAKAAQLKDMVAIMMNATPLLMELGVPFNIKRLMEMWFEAEGIDDVDALFETDEEQQMRQMLSLMQQAQGAVPGGPEGNVPAGAATGPGQPRPQTTGAPSALPDEGNSGILGPNQQS